ncbi:Helix-turn-helix [Virgibacillus subterraneus]|uniref:Helix-turn-helix n=1 Tax=Virgibacillus subterraneus TaxID=621109 RepID=A0A1H8Z011_9BACI|nr:helix-turn-helix transcriptional regulator [Virgibacillus subterraneus]SEP57696.1 Helix-turn-helix [Virgibacillus subterraneus]
MRVGAILKACRTRAGFSQEELADKLYISQSDVSKYENDTMEPHISTLQAWTNNTQTQEVMVAFLCGVDGLSVMQSVLDFAVGTVGTILLGGIL